MNQFKQLSNADNEQWDAAVVRYDALINQNASARVGGMNAADLKRYCDRYNTPTDSREDVLGHMMRWGGFRGMLLAGGLVREQSGLFKRLLAGKDPLPSPPPRNFGAPWYELFDEPPGTGFECHVLLKGKSTRLRDAGKSVWVFAINDCPWECDEANESGLALLAVADKALSLPDGQLDAGTCRSVMDAMAATPAFVMTFGQYKSKFKMSLEPSSPDQALGTTLGALPCPGSNNVFGWSYTGNDFPAFWVLRAIG